MHSEERIHELEEFRSKLGVPAVFAGVLKSSGNLEFDVVGTRCRRSREPAAHNDQVHIGSCLKMITATLFGVYVSQGKADWNMPLTDLFPDLNHDLHPDWQRRQVWELFCCVSGMVANPPRQILRTGYTDKRPLLEQRDDMVRFALSQAPRKPGRFVYSNMSYIVMGAAIDRLSNSSYEDALEEVLLKPIGVKSHGYGPPPLMSGHGSKFKLSGFHFGKSKPSSPTKPESDNPPVLSAAGTLHLECTDWAKLLRLFLSNNQLEIVDEKVIERVIRMPSLKSAKMSMGWAPVLLDGASFAAQGSNTLWAATAMMDQNRERTAFVVCNDGRTTVLGQSVHLAMKMLQS